MFIIIVKLAYRAGAMVKFSISTLIYMLIESINITFWAEAMPKSFVSHGIYINSVSK